MSIQSEGSSLLKVALASVAVLALSAAGAQTQEQSADSEAASGDAANGKKIYASYGCYQCHGYQGQGSPRSGPRIAPDPVPFELFRYVVREPPEQMPPYTEKVISDQEIADIYAYLKTVPPPPDVESIPQLQ